MTIYEFAQETRQEVTQSPREMRRSVPENPTQIVGADAKPEDLGKLPAPKFTKSSGGGENQQRRAGLSPTPSVPASFATTSSDPSRLSEAKIIELLVAEIGQTNYDLWFGAGCEFVVKPNRVAVRASSKFALKRLQSTFGNNLRQVVNRLAGPQIELTFETDASIGLEQMAIIESNVDSVAETIPLHAPASEQKKSKVRRQRLSTFWFGENNKLAKASVDQLLADLGQFSPLLFYGPCGSGKSHLLSAVTYEARRLGGRKCVYLSAEQFTSLFLQSLRGSGLPMFRRKYRDLDLLAIDDIQFFAGKKATLNEFQYTIDNLMQAGKQILISSDRPPAELGELGPDIATRLTSGLVAPLAFPGLEGRISIAKQMCEERKFDIRDDVLAFACERIRSDVRQLSGVVNRIQLAQVASGGKQISVNAAAELLDDLISEVSTGTSMRQIEKVVCEMCGVQANELKSNSRKKRICTARMLAMFLSREHTNAALSEIGDFFGRSHSTVIAAQKNVNQWLSSNSELSLPNANYRAKDVLRRIENELRVG